MANLGLEAALEEIGFSLTRTAVGDRYVLEEMLSSGAIVGGEQSGHVIPRQYSQTGVIPPLKQAFGRGPTELPLGGQGIAGMQRRWQPGGIGNQPGQPPMGASMNLPQLNRTAVMPPGYQSQGQSNPAWQNPSLPWDPQQGGGGFGGGRIVQGGPPPQMGGNGMGTPGWGQPRPQMQPPFGGRGIEREQRPYPNPVWGGGGSPVQKQPWGQMPLPGPQGRGIFF